MRAFFQHRIEALRLRFFGFKIVVFCDVGDADDEDAHLPAGTMDDAWGNVDEGAWRDGLLNAIQQHRAAAGEDVVELGGAFVVMQLGPINVHGMCPGGR